MTTPPLRMTSGMSLEDRQKLREQVRQKLVAEAEERAGTMYRSEHCQLANRMALPGSGYTSDQVRREHATCLAETAGNGCLDECHDAALGLAAERDGS